MVPFSPDDIEHHYTTIHGIRMHYIRAGHGERLVVLLHGFPECWYSWRFQIPVLAEYATVIAPDLRGYNETEKPPWGYDLASLAADIEALIHAAGFTQAIIVGHDWGGMVAWEVARRYPAIVAQLAVLNAPHPAWIWPALLRDPRQLLRSWYMLFFQIPWLPELLLRHDHFAFVTNAMERQNRHAPYLSSSDKRFFRQAIARPGALHAVLRYYRQALWQGLFTAHGSAPVLATTHCLWSDHDQYLGQALFEQTSRFVPNLTTRVARNASHWIQQEQPALINSWLIAILNEEQV